MAERRAVAVTLAGKQYRIVTDADEAWMQAVAARVDKAMALVRDRTETVDSLDVALLTALNLARELSYWKEQAGRNREDAASADQAVAPARVAAASGGDDALRGLIEVAEGALEPTSAG